MGCGSVVSSCATDRLRDVLNDEAKQLIAGVAAKTLMLAMKEDWNEASRILGGLNLAARPQLAMTMCLLWCEAYVQHSLDGRDPTKAVAAAMVSQELGSGSVTLSGRGPKMDDDQWWAQQFMYACGTRNAPVTKRLLDEMLKEGTLTRMAALLEIIATTITHTERGYGMKTVGPGWLN